MSSTYGENLRLTIFGQSHGPAIGVTVEGLPAGFAIDLESLHRFLRRRAPGGSPTATARQESDIPQFLSGLVGNVTCGAPLTAIIPNADIRSPDYDAFRDCPRPGHADYTAQRKFRGFQDSAGGGHFSGRLTAPLCLAGGICLQMLSKLGITVGAHIQSIGPVTDTRWNPVTLDAASLLAPSQKPFPVLDDGAGTQMQSAILSARQKGDSLGGVIECAALGLPAGLGDPMFYGMENRIAQAIFAIPAVRGIEFGEGFHAAEMTGSQHNDPYYMDGENVKTRTNHHGGILGGITSGMPLIFRVAVKPTPSISRPQESVSLSTGEPRRLEITGRHDPCIVPRAVSCVEAAAAIAIFDAFLQREKEDFPWN